MALSWVWIGMILTAAVYAAASGTAAETGAAAAEGALAAVRLGAGMLGSIMFWSGLNEVMERAGITAALSRCLGPLLRRLYPSCREDRELAGELSCNLCANVLGMGSAATPAGIRAAVRLRVHADDGALSRELCTLVVMNSASVQLLPATVAAVRASLGSAEPFGILPAVWIASGLSLAAGLSAVWLLYRWD